MKLFDKARRMLHWRKSSRIIDFAGDRESVINNSLRTMARNQFRNREDAVRHISRRNELAALRPECDGVGRRDLERKIAEAEKEMAAVKWRIRKEEERFRSVTTRAVIASVLVEAEAIRLGLDRIETELHAESATLDRPEL